MEWKLVKIRKVVAEVGEKQQVVVKVDEKQGVVVKWM